MLENITIFLIALSASAICIFANEKRGSPRIWLIIGQVIMIATIFGMPALDPKMNHVIGVMVLPYLYILVCVAVFSRRRSIEDVKK